MYTLEIDSKSKTDNVKGILFSLIIFVLLFILLKFVTYGYIQEEPIEDVLEINQTLPDAITMHKFETSEKQGGGSGQATNAPKSNENTPQMDKTIRDANSTSTDIAAKGNSNHTNQNKSSENEASTLDPGLGFKKSGGSGGGDNGGKGKGFGGDEGNGEGPGKGEGKKERIRLNNPNTNNISSNISCKINLKLTVNAEGDVLRASNVVANTTTTNQTVINQLIFNVKEQVKYNKVSGSGTEIVYLTVNISAK